MFFRQELAGSASSCARRGGCERRRVFHGYIFVIVDVWFGVDGAEAVATAGGLFGVFAFGLEDGFAFAGGFSGVCEFGGGFVGGGAGDGDCFGCAFDGGLRLGLSCSALMVLLIVLGRVFGGRLLLVVGFGVFVTAIACHSGFDFRDCILGTMSEALAAEGGAAHGKLVLEVVEDRRFLPIEPLLSLEHAGD